MPFPTTNLLPYKLTNKYSTNIFNKKISLLKLYSELIYTFKFFNENNENFK